MKIKISKAKNWTESIVLWVVLMIPHLKTDYMNEVMELDFIFNIGRVISGLFIIIMICENRKTCINTLTVMLLLSQFGLVISTFINGIPPKNAFLRIISVVCLTLLLNFIFEKNTRRALYSVLVVLDGYIYINFLSILLFAEGLYKIGGERKYFFLGHVNVSILYILPAIIVALIILKESNSRIMKMNCCITIIVGIVTELITWSATSLVGLAIAVLLIVGNRCLKLKFDFINAISGFLSGILLTISILFFQIQNHFQYLIESILHRSLDFTRRIRMWVITLDYIFQNKWYGYGVEALLIRQKKIGGPNAHNSYLEILYQGGIIGFMLFSLFFIILAKEMGKYKRYSSIKYIAVAVFVMEVMGVTESFYGLTAFYILLILGINSESIASLSKEKELLL